MLEELVDVYNKDKHLTGKIIRRKDINLLNDDEYIITVHCFIINLSNQILLTQRSLSKNRGGKWEETHGGLKSGETSILGIQRELKEKIGIDIKHNELKLVKTLKRKNRFRDIYIVKKDIPIDTIKYNDGEVMNCKYVTLEQFKMMIKNNECTFEKFEDIIFCDYDINFFREKIIMNIKIVNDAKLATGLAVIIDVFRAFTVEPYLISNGAKKIIPVGDMQIAYEYKEKDNNYILIGERNGIKLPGFDYGNSPSQIENIDFTEKTIVHTTSCGTQGIVRAINAKEIITGSLVNAHSIVRYIVKNNIDEVSLVALARPKELPSDEDILCAKYIKCMLENRLLSNYDEEIEKLKTTSGSKFFNKLNQNDFPERDFYLCTEVNKFNFILKVKKDVKNNLHIEKIDV